ncbi:RNA polymerase sigma factor [bacterium]|jgi:RNA polymerase sigma-70 factor, ECF subfamily|nr:RNA polymerase sigma factor [bacterium]MBT4649501.1 RNA polymerase sigma factor [bacterium]
MKGLKTNLKEKIAFLKLKNGDLEAFGFFYDKYVKQIYRFILLKVSNTQIAEDLTQDVFLKTWQHLVDQKSLSHFRAFIYRIARNIVIDHYRQSNRQPLPIDEVADDNLPTEEIADLDISLDVAKVKKYLAQIKPAYQEILILKYIEDLSFEEIAEVLQKDKNNVRVLLHRATNKLKYIISEGK